MRIVMSYSGGTYRGVQLASEFNRAGTLSDLFIPYYSAKHPLLTVFFERIEDKQLIETSKVKTNLRFCLMRKMLARTERLRGVYFNHSDRLLLSKRWDKWVSARLTPGADSFLCESVFSLSSMRQAKRLGMKVFLDSLTAHILLQDEIMKTESTRSNFAYSLDHAYAERLLEEYENADYIAVPSSFARESFIEKGVNAEKVICVKPGIDLSYFSPVPKEDGTFRVVYCGILGYKKGVQYLLEAFSSLRLKNAELLLIGHVHSNFSGILKKYSGKFRHIEFLPNYALYRHYSQGSVFVLPSLEDSFGKVTVEAMACGLPVIVTDRTGSKDAVSDGLNGFIVPAGDAQSLGEKLLFFYENQVLCREMGIEAMRKVRSESTLQHYYQQMRSVMEARLR